MGKAKKHKIKKKLPPPLIGRADGEDEDEDEGGNSPDGMREWSMDGEDQDYTPPSDFDDDGDWS